MLVGTTDDANGQLSVMEFSVGRRVARLAAAMALLGAASAHSAPAGRFSSQRLVDGTIAPAHSSQSGEPSDSAAARRRAEILGSPYAQISERRSLRGGEIVLALPAELAPGVAERLACGVVSATAELFHQEGWSAPFSARSPLLLLVTRDRGDVPATSGWDGRDHGDLVHPVVAVAGGRGPEAVLLSAVQQIALLTVRQAAPEEAGWAAEGVAEWLARRALGYDADPVAAEDPLVAESGSLRSPETLARFLQILTDRLPGGAGEIRHVWEELGLVRGDDGETFVRELGNRTDTAGVAGLLSEQVARRLGSAGLSEPAADVRRRTVLGEVSVTAPEPLGWSCLSFRTGEERGALEIVLPSEPGVAAGRAVVLYRGPMGGFDTVPLAPGAGRVVPISGTRRLALVLADGDAGELFVRLRRLTDYPAVLLGGGAEWRDGAVQITWKTSAHRDLLGWVVVRYGESDEGDPVEEARQIVPSSAAAQAGYAYNFADRDVDAGHRYRYRVFALTTEGLLAESFEAVVVAGR